MPDGGGDGPVGPSPPPSGRCSYVWPVPAAGYFERTLTSLGGSALDKCLKSQLTCENRVP